MAGERTLPGIGLVGFWNLGSGYKTQMDANLRTLSTLTQLRAISRVTALPGSPTNGDIYIVPTGGANANEIAIRDNGAWVYFVPAEGYMAYIADEDTYYLYSGSAWALAFGPKLVTEATTGRTLTNVDFDGRTIINCTNSSATLITLNTGLTAMGPCFIRQAGTGLVTIGGTATLQSLGGILDARGQYSMIGIVPLGANVYDVSGVDV
jgi:hypothetical protein